MKKKTSTSINVRSGSIDAKQQAELDALVALPDDEINTESIPEIID